MIRCRPYDRNQTTIITSITMMWKLCVEINIVFGWMFWRWVRVIFVNVSCLLVINMILYSCDLLNMVKHVCA